MSSSKIEIINRLIDAGHNLELRELLSGISPFSKVIDPPESVAVSIETIKLVNAVKNHFLFISKYGKNKSHVIEDGCHYFAAPEKVEEWLKLGAPGISEEDVTNLYNYLFIS